MNILLASYVFAPGTGGIETMSAVLAEAFVKQGHSVRVVTETPYDGEDCFPYEVIRGPAPGRRIALMRWADVFFQNNISLQTLWPLLLVRRPWVVAHHTWLTDIDGSVGRSNRLKRLLIRYAANIAVSRAIAKELPVRSVVIGNCYREKLFRLLPEIPRTRDLVFLGRLVRDKGADLLIEAMAGLKPRGLRPDLTIVGSGEELPRLQAAVAEGGLEDQVRFVGTKTGEDLVKLLNAHRIIVAPSRWKEPFGLVALEGIACGCVAVGSEGGGLKDAVGPCGRTFPNGDAEALGHILEELLRRPETQTPFRDAAPTHLARFTPDAVAGAYLDVFRRAGSRDLE